VVKLSRWSTVADSSCLRARLRRSNVYRRPGTWSRAGCRTLGRLRARHAVSARPRGAVGLARSSSATTRRRRVPGGSVCSN
jgi:hypothetical protein